MKHIINIMMRSWCMGLLVLLGLLYFTLTSAYITDKDWHKKESRSQSQIVDVHIYSPLGRDVQLNILASSAIEQLTMGEQDVEPGYPYPPTRVSYNDKQFGDVYPVRLRAGENVLRASLKPESRRYSFVVGQRYSFFDFLVGLITIVLPLGWAAYTAFLIIFDRMRRMSGHSLPFAYVILFVAVILKLWYFWDMGSTQFQHDWHGHIEYLEFFANEFFIPLPHKAWEFPQQPLYYLVNGALWAVLASLGVAKDSILLTISGIGTLFSCVSLFFAYRLLLCLTPNRLVHNIALSFLCFTPSIIYMGARINNDAWAMSLALLALYFMVSSYQSGFTRKVLPAVVFCALAFLTKISMLVLQLLFIALLITAYIERVESVKRAGAYFVLCGVTILSYTLYRAYYPVGHSFFLVNSGIWGGQDLRPIGVNYFFSFHFFDLLADAQGNITGTDNHVITRSFPTYHYITMLFGEFRYDYWRDRSYFLFFNMQMLCLLALIIPVSWIAYFFATKTRLEKFFMMAIGISLLLIVKFIFTYPSVSNTDFRYHLGVFFMLAYAFAQGVAYLCHRFPKVRTGLYVWVSALFVFNITFMVTLIRL